MKTVVNTIPLLAQKTGIGRYIFEVARLLEKEIDLTYYYGYYSKSLSPQQTETKRLLDKLPLLKKIARKIVQKRPSFEKFDLYWEPNFIPLPAIQADHTITTVHDFSFLHHPQWHPKERIEYFKENFFKNIDRSDLLITPSITIREEAKEILKIDNIEVIYHGIDHNLYNESPKMLPFDLPFRYILFVGSIEPRKNLYRLLKAYIGLPQSFKKEYKLLLAGFTGWKNEEIVNLIQNNKNDIRYLGYVSDEELAALYTNASLFVYPSIYEGFGFPPLEAMACGTPTIVSNIAVFRELYANVALFADPLDVEDLREKIVQVLDNRELSQNIRQKGLELAKRFTWEASMQHHLQLFEKIC